MGILRVNWNNRATLSEFRIFPEHKIAAARAIATWDPHWRDHVWDITVDGNPQDGIMFTFSYREKALWLSGPVATDYRYFDLEFRKWAGQYVPTCNFCGEYVDHDKQMGHLRWCIGWMAYKVDSRWNFPFGVFPATDSDRYRKEKEVVEELLAFGFRDPGAVWKHLLAPSARIVERAGYWNDGSASWWCQYWVKREWRRTKLYYLLSENGDFTRITYYAPGGRLVCQVKEIDDLWYCFTPKREKLPHGFTKPIYAVAYYYPAPGTQLELVRRYVHESRWPFIRSKSYKALKLAA